MEQRPGPWFESLRRSHERLASIVGELDRSAYRNQSYDSDWSIAEVLSHIGSGSEIFALFIDAGLSGEEPPGRERFEPIWAEWQSRSPEQQVEDGVAASRQLVERFEALDDEQRHNLSLEIFGMRAGAAMLARMRLAEHALHTWDVEVVGDREAPVAGDAVELLIDDLSRFAARAGKPAGEKLRVHVTTSNPTRHFVLEESDRVTLTPIEDKAADGEAELRIPAEGLIRLVYGRLDAGHTPRELEATGVELDELRKRFPGV